MPTLETPPNPAPPTPTPEQESPAPLRIQAGRFGEMDHTELVHLIDTLGDERERSRFRESIYISLFFYIALAWFILYGPRYLWHTPQVVPIKTDSEHKGLTYLETPRDLQRVLPKSKSPAPRPAPAPRPEPAQRTPEPPAPRPQQARPQPAPQKPLPPTPQPQQPTPVAQQPRPSPPAPQPRPQQSAASSIPDAPRPSSQSSSRPSFASPNQSLSDIAKGAIPGRGGSGSGEAGSPGKPGLASGAEILSPTLGVDFDPYIKQILRMIRAGWIPLIPEETQPPLNKEGQTLIRFTILPDGTLAAGSMHLDASTHDTAIDKAAWGGIRSVGQFPPLPAAFKGPNLELRIQFIITNSAHGHNSAE